MNVNWWCVCRHVHASRSKVTLVCICSISCWNISFWLFLVWRLKSISFAYNPGTRTVDLLGAWFGSAKGRLLRCVKWFPRLFQNCWCLIRRSDDAEKWVVWSSSKAQSSVTFDTVLKACAICEDWRVTLACRIRCRCDRLSVDAEFCWAIEHKSALRTFSTRTFWCNLQIWGRA